MGLEIGTALLMIGAAIFFHAANSHEYKLIGKWIFLLSLLLTAFFFYTYDVTNNVTLAFLIGLIGMVVLIFAYDVVAVFIPFLKIIAHRSKR